MTTTTPYPDVPVPAGAEADIWAGDYRILYGVSRGVIGHTLIVQTTAVQLLDGTVDDGQGPAEEPPAISVEVHPDRHLTSEQARDLAAVLIESADEVDRWSAR